MLHRLRSPFNRAESTSLRRTRSESFDHSRMANSRTRDGSVICLDISRRHDAGFLLDLFSSTTFTIEIKNKTNVLFFSFFLLRSMTWRVLLKETGGEKATLMRPTEELNYSLVVILLMKLTYGGGKEQLSGCSPELIRREAVFYLMTRKKLDYEDFKRRSRRRSGSLWFYSEISGDEKKRNRKDWLIKEDKVDTFVG